MRQIGSSKNSPSSTNFFFKSAWCSYHILLVTSLPTLYNDCFTLSSPNLHVHPHSQLRTSPPTSQRNRSHQAELSQSIPTRPAHTLPVRQPCPPLPFLQRKHFHRRGQFFHHLCSRSCPLSPGHPSHHAQVSPILNNNNRNLPQA